MEGTYRVPDDWSVELSVSGAAAQGIARNMLVATDVKPADVNEADLVIQTSDGTAVDKHTEGPQAGVLLFQMVGAVDWGEHSVESIRIALNLDENGEGAEVGELVPTDAGGESGGGPANTGQSADAAADAEPATTDGGVKTRKRATGPGAGGASQKGAHKRYTVEEPEVDEPKGLEYADTYNHYALRAVASVTEPDGEYLTAKELWEEMGEDIRSEFDEKAQLSSALQRLFIRNWLVDRVLFEAGSQGRAPHGYRVRSSGLACLRKLQERGGE